MRGQPPKYLFLEPPLGRALFEEPKAPRGARARYGKRSSSPPEEALGRKMEHFGVVFKLDLTEETRTQLSK